MQRPGHRIRRPGLEPGSNACVLKRSGSTRLKGTPNGYKGVHAFRHTFGVVMQEQVGALETQALFGHNSLTTTMRYSKVTSRKASERARKAQEALGESVG